MTGKHMCADEREAKATAAHRMADSPGPAQLENVKCSGYCGAAPTEKKA